MSRRGSARPTDSLEMEDEGEEGVKEIPQVPALNASTRCKLLRQKMPASNAQELKFGYVGFYILVEHSRGAI